MKFILTLFLFNIISFHAQSQIATSSFFGQMESINLGVLNKRRAGFFAVGANKDEYSKGQNFTADQVQGTNPGKATSDVAINNTKIFRGGKGGTFTSEFSFISTKGTLTDNITLDNGQVTTAESSANVTYASFHTGLSVIGIGASFFQYKYSSAFNISIDTENYNRQFDANISGLTTSLGWAGSLGSLKMGLLARMVRTSLESTGTNELENVSNSSMGVMVGAGIGIETPRFHMELGIERPLVDVEPPANAVDVNRDPVMRLNGVIEMKFGGLALGYMGTYYSGVFSDASTTVERQLVYTAPENRLINKINLALGASKGLSVSGSYSTSKITTQEKVPFSGTVAIPTEVTSKSVSVEVSYVF